MNHSTRNAFFVAVKSLNGSDFDSHFLKMDLMSMDESCNEENGSPPNMNGYKEEVDDGVHTKMSSDESDNEENGVSQDDYEDTRSRVHKYYDWKLYSPSDGHLLHFLRWIMVGGAAYAKQSDEVLQENLKSLARCLLLLREYESRFGVPVKGGLRDQEYVIREVYKALYEGCAPVWALEPVMEKAAEGLTGQRGVNFFLLPRKAFMFVPSSGATTMFRTDRGFCISKLDSMEPIVIRLASFASNTRGVSSVPTRLPQMEELKKACRSQSAIFGGDSLYDKEELAAEILSLASDAEGLFFFINTTSQSLHGTTSDSTPRPTDEFWKVDESTRDVFSRLATMEAMDAINKIDAEEKELYSPLVIIFFRLCSSAGACAIWFNGSWQDMLVAGVLAIVVAFIGSSPLSKQERIIIEVIASFVVGLVAGLIALKWPDDTCFGAMAIAGVLDILQGFRVVYAIIEVMSKHTVTGGANFLEGLLYTGLIAYFLKFGQYIAMYTMGDSRDAEFLQCSHGINELYYLLFVPLAAVSWSGLFMPNYRDLPLMAFHGILAYVVNWSMARASLNEDFNNFVASASVTLSAGIISRFTGRQAMGNTVAGIYVLLPGAYLVNALYTSETEDFFTDIIFRAVIIGIGAWTGTMLCSPTLLGTTRGLLAQGSKNGGPTRGDRRDRIKPNAMFFF
jgi:uncharacterized membrane protein YjjP (DUF1212 family)